MTESVDDGDVSEQGEFETVLARDTEALFGSYAVLSPGVEIVLEGRPISAPAAD